MAEALISVLLEKLVSVVYEYTTENVKLVLNAEKDVQSFKSSLKAIQAVLQDAEKRQVTEAGVADWLQKLKDVSFEMDDVLDEWNTKLLRQKVEKNDDAENTFKVCFPIPCDCFCFGQVNEVIPHHTITNRIKQLNEELSLIAAERQNYVLQPTQIGIPQELPERQKTSSFVNLTEIFGRDLEKGKLVNLLVSDSSQERSRVLVIPVIGMGGMGKTTLARLAYNDQSVQSHFKKKIWVCVSEPFNEIRIAKAIIEGIDAPSVNSNELQAVLLCLSKSIEGKKFLLVLDDVWTEDNRKWEQLELTLMQSGARGSRIVVTSRKEEVARMMSETLDHMIKLNKLSEHDSCSLFNHIVCLGREKGETNVCEEDIGKKIVGKCRGLPLAIKTLGSLLRYKKTRREWEDVVNSEMWELKEIKQQVFQSLLISYYDLDSNIKQCLLYCAIFRKDYVYQKNRLIELWMSQNYISFKENKNERQLGEKYFESLVMRSFFQDFTTDHLGNITGCKVHDIVHDFLQFLTKKECIYKSVEGANQIMELPGDKFRHLTIIHDPNNPRSFPTSFNNCKNVRTLSVIGSKIRDISPGIILELKCLRTLNLSHNALKVLPEEIGKLTLLRYMDLSRSWFLEELPDSLCSLYNLQTLLLNKCYGLEKLPKAMGKLISLKHLYVAECRKLDYLPKGIGRLENLLAVDYIPRKDNSDEALRLGDLGIMKQLQGSISIGSLGHAEDVSEVEKASFGNKQDLLSLELHFEYFRLVAEKRKSDEEILKAVQPHQNLESLLIFGCHAANTSECLYWINSLHNLRSLHLDGWKFCEDLPPLGQLPSLEILRIVSMRKVKKVGFEFLGVEEEETLAGGILFPKLKSLDIRNMERLEEWEGTMREGKEITVMPRLSSLRISDCIRLKALPDFLQNIEELNSLFIGGCPSLRRENECPKISRIPNIQFNEHEFNEDELEDELEDEFNEDEFNEDELEDEFNEDELEDEFNEDELEDEFNEDEFAFIILGS